MHLRLTRAYPYLLFLAALLLYALSLLPGVGQADTAEFQRVLPTGGLAHPTGYPLYTMLGWAWTRLPLGGSMAWRTNLLSAVLGALTTVALYQTGLAMRLGRLISTAGALSFATSLAFWVQATRAEVYALAIAIQAGQILALLHWRAGRLPLWAPALIFGLGLAHHRMIVLLAPGALVFALAQGWPRPRALAAALLAVLVPGLLYLHVLAQLPPWSERWDAFRHYVLAEDFARMLFRPGQLLEDGLARPLMLFRGHIRDQFLLIGVPLQLLGAIRLIRRDRALAALLLLSALVLALFCSAYYVSDIDVFLIPLHALGALLLAQGLAAIADLLPARRARLAGLAALALPVALLATNWGSLRVINGGADEMFARAIMAHRFPERSMVIGDWGRIESLRYLQAVEGQHPSIDLIITFDAREMLPSVREALAAGRQVYALDPMPGLGLDQAASGPVWRFADRPLAIAPDTPAGIRWAGGIALAAYSLPAGPYLPGQSVPIAVAWAAEAAPPAGYSLFIHLIDGDGQLWGQHDGPPSVATAAWEAGGEYKDLYAPLLSPETPPGRYQVRLGWYSYPSMERLALVDGADFAVIGEIEVRPPGVAGEN